MITKPDVLLMTADPAVVTRVASALATNGHTLVGRTARDPRELIGLLQGNPAPFALVDLDADPARTLAEVEPIAAAYPATRFVALVSAMPADLIMEAMQVGIRQIVLKEKIGGDLSHVLDRLTLVLPKVNDQRGEVVTVLSAGGGCGATTLAVNLARELAEGAGSPALLVDLDTAYGAAANYLGVSAAYGVADVLTERREVDAHLVRTTASAYSPTLHLLASPATTCFGAPCGLAYDRLPSLLGCVRQAYRHAVIDAPRVSMDVAAMLAKGSAKTVLMFQLSVKDLRVARSMMQALRDRGVPQEAVAPLASRWQRWGQAIGLDEARKVLGGCEVHCVRNDYKSATRGLTYGQPLAEAAPRSSLRADLQSLVAKMNPVSVKLGR